MAVRQEPSLESSDLIVPGAGVGPTLVLILGSQGNSTGQQGLGITVPDHKTLGKSKLAHDKERIVSIQR